MCVTVLQCELTQVLYTLSPLMKKGQQIRSEFLSAKLSPNTQTVQVRL